MCALLYRDYSLKPKVLCFQEVLLSMGIKGLLPCLRSITRPSSLEKYRGLTVAVDAMSWLHKGIYASDVRSLAKAQWVEKIKINGSSSESRSNGKNKRGGKDCAVKRLDFEGTANGQNLCSRTQNSSLVDSKKASEAATKCIAYAMRHAKTLQRDFAMEVIMVIDGGSLPSKSDIDLQRRQDRHKSFQRALDAEERGDSRNARKLYASACSITQSMRHELIKSCKRSSIAFIVAPYEADAQMAQVRESIVFIILSRYYDSSQCIDNLYPLSIYSTFCNLVSSLWPG